MGDPGLGALQARGRPAGGPPGPAPSRSRASGAQTASRGRLSRSEGRELAERFRGELPRAQAQRHPQDQEGRRARRARTVGRTGTASPPGRVVRRAASETTRPRRTSPDQEVDHLPSPRSAGDGGPGLAEGTGHARGATAPAPRAPPPRRRRGPRAAPSRRAGPHRPGRRAVRRRPPRHPRATTASTAGPASAAPEQHPRRHRRRARGVPQQRAPPPRGPGRGARSGPPSPQMAKKPGQRTAASPSESGEGRRPGRAGTGASNANSAEQRGARPRPGWPGPPPARGRRPERSEMSAASVARRRRVGTEGPDRQQRLVGRRAGRRATRPPAPRWCGRPSRAPARAASGPGARGGRGPRRRPPSAGALRSRGDVAGQGPGDRRRRQGAGVVGRGRDHVLREETQERPEDGGGQRERTPGPASGSPPGSTTTRASRRPPRAPAPPSRGRGRSARPGGGRARGGRGGRAISGGSAESTVAHSTPAGGAGISGYHRRRDELPRRPAGGALRLGRDARRLRRQELPLLRQGLRDLRDRLRPRAVPADLHPGLVPDLRGGGPPPGPVAGGRRPLDAVLRGGAERAAARAPGERSSASPPAGFPRGWSRAARAGASAARSPTFSLEDFFGPAVVCGGETERRKPDPEPLLVGLERLGVTPDEAVYVGDSPEDVTMARAAGRLRGRHPRRLPQPRGPRRRPSPTSSPRASTPRVRGAPDAGPLSRLRAIWPVLRPGASMGSRTKGAGPP